MSGSRPRWPWWRSDTRWLRFTGVAEEDEFAGSFHEFSVSLCMDGNDLATAGIEVTVQTVSVETGDSMRDSELRGTTKPAKGGLCLNS